MSEYVAPKQKQVTGELLDMVLNMTEKDFSKTFIKKYFGRKCKVENGKFISIEPKLNSYDKIDIPVGRYCGNKTVIKTHVGKFILFKFLFEKELSDIVKLEDYLDAEAITSKIVEEFTSKIATAATVQKIKPLQMITYLDKLQFWFKLANILNSSISKKTGKSLASVRSKKEKLIRENKEALDSGDSIAAAKIEKELLELAKSELDGDYGMDIYNSGANASFNNNYKAMFVMKGPVKDNLTGKTNIVTSNYSDGVKKEDLHPHFDALVEGAFSKGVATQVAGYLTKKFLAGYQGVVLDKKGTDCKSKFTFNITLTKFNISFFRYNYIVEGNKYILLTDDVINKYLNKRVKMRLPGGCANDKICSICAGELPYITNETNMGLSTISASGTLLNKSMKKFHDTSVKLVHLSIDDIIM